MQDFSQLQESKTDEFVKSQEKGETVMLNLVQHLTKPKTNETLKQVQGDKPGPFARPSKFEDNVASENDANKWDRYEIKRAY